MNARLHAEVAKALAQVRCIALPDDRERLCQSLPRQLARRVDRADTPFAFAHRLVLASGDLSRLGCLLRWVNYLEEDTITMRTVVQAAAVLVEAEEAELFAASEDARSCDHLRTLRPLMHARDYAEVEGAYLAETAQHLAPLPAPFPRTAWEALVDLFDLPAGRDGRRPVERFASRVAASADPGLAEPLRRWLDLTATAPADTAADSSAVRGEPDARVKSPGRLVVQIHPSPADPELYQVDHWTILSPVAGGEPEFSPRGVTEDLPFDEVKARLNALIRMVEARPQRRNHDRVRLELLVPMGLATRFLVATWETESAILDEPPRIGSQVEIILRISEFVTGWGEYGLSQGKCARRWEILEEGGDGMSFDRERDRVAPGIRFSERLADERIVVFIAGSSEGASWRNDVLTAVSSGVPVVVWRSARKAEGGMPRPLFTETGGRVSLQELQELPKRLHRVRLGSIRHQDPDYIDASSEVSVVYHDTLPVLAASGGDYSTARIR